MAGKRLALIVATDEYLDPGLRRLRAPAKDAEALAGVLGDPELGDFEVDVLRNGTSSAIGERVETLLTAGKPDDLIVMHFSCHGLKDDTGELYLAATNTRPGLLASTAVDASLVNRLMRRSRAQRVVLFLDCCYGGAFERGVVPRAGGVIDLADQFQQREDELGGGRGRVVITASNAMEFAFEGADLADSIATQPSMFTGALVEGLTSGEADRDQDGMVSLGELYDYVFDRVRQESPNQTPGKWEFGLQGDLVLAKNPQRVVIAAPVPAELLELIDHPFPATRLGSVEVLARLAEGTNLPVAAGARIILERMVHDDSRGVAAAATEALAASSLRLSVADVDLGHVDVGSEAAADVSIEGVPLATASRAEASTAALRVRRVDQTIRIEADTSAAGPIDGIVTVVGPAGSADVHVVGLVTAGGARDGPPRVQAAKVDQTAAEFHRHAAGADAVRAPQPAADVPGLDALIEPARVTSAPTDATAPWPPRALRLGAWWPSLRGKSRRGLLAGFLGVLMVSVGYLVLYPDPSQLALAVKAGAIQVVAIAAANVITEPLLPGLRMVLDARLGPGFRDRRRVAAVQGAVLGAVAAVIVYQLKPMPDTLLYLLVAYPVFLAIGFALAESVLGSGDTTDETPRPST
jgi:caspase domain-containing protein